ncbi:acyltransferase family protein [Proteus penneri]|uniref:acyltransferase family protein n=1 Tax=Proteus penneri TaxID=102862 RepID=UPI002889C7BE|nr:acyltransferase [Proteus penneri]
MNKTRLDSIQVLRGIAAILVVLFHFRHYINDVYPVSDLGDRLFLFGEAGVDLFFVISGFIIVYSSVNKEKNSFSEFIIKRIFRLYPLYFFVLTIYLLAYHDEIFLVTNLIKSYLLIPIDYNGKGPWFGLSTIYTAWTLTYELYFYLIFSFAILISHKYRALICTLIILIVMTGSQLLIYNDLFINPITSKGDFSGFFYNFIFTSSPLIIDFIYGMFIAYAYIFYDKLNIRFKIITFISILLLSISIIYMLSSATGKVGPLNWGLCSVGIVFSLLIITKNTDIKYPTFLIYLGEMSYSIYINHVVVKKVAFSYIGPLGLFKSGDGALILFSLVIITLCISYGTYNFIEKPSVKLGRNLAEKIRLKKAK